MHCGLCCNHKGLDLALLSSLTFCGRGFVQRVGQLYRHRGLEDLPQCLPLHQLMGSKLRPETWPQVTFHTTSPVALRKPQRPYPSDQPAKQTRGEPRVFAVPSGGSLRQRPGMVHAPSVRVGDFLFLQLSPNLGAPLLVHPVICTPINHGQAEPAGSYTQSETRVLTVNGTDGEAGVPAGGDLNRRCSPQNPLRWALAGALLF